jgi:tetratricopeptide (TPR) repeat protein
MKPAFIVFLFTFLCFSLQVDGQTPQPTYGDLLGQAFGAKAKGQYRQGIAALKEAIRIDSSEKYWRYYNLAEFYTLAADYSPAFTYLDCVLHSPIADKVHWRNETFRPLWKQPRWQPFRQKIAEAQALLLAQQSIFDQMAGKVAKRAKAGV